MKVYLAARYSRYPEMQGYAEQLRALGHEVTARWILGDHELRSDGQSDADEWVVRWAQEDLGDLCRAGAVISFTEEPGAPGRQRGGRHVEFGIALSMLKRCIVVGPRENVFHHLPQVQVVANFYEAILALSRPLHAGTGAAGAAPAEGGEE